jgi:hypothetical protein
MIRLKLDKKELLKKRKIEKRPKLLRILLFSKKSKTNSTKKESKEKLSPEPKLKLIERLNSSKKRKNLKLTKGKLTWRRKSLKTS